MEKLLPCAPWAIVIFILTLDTFEALYFGVFTSNKLTRRDLPELLINLRGFIRSRSRQSNGASLDENLRSDVAITFLFQQLKYNAWQSRLRNHTDRRWHFTIDVSRELNNTLDPGCLSSLSSRRPKWKRHSRLNF